MTNRFSTPWCTSTTLISHEAKWYQVGDETHVLHPGYLSLQLGEAAQDDDVVVHSVIRTVQTMLLRSCNASCVGANRAQRRETFYERMSQT